MTSCDNKDTCCNHFNKTLQDKYNCFIATLLILINMTSNLNARALESVPNLKQIFPIGIFLWFQTYKLLQKYPCFCCLFLQNRIYVFFLLFHFYNQYKRTRLTMLVKQKICVVWGASCIKNTLTSFLEILGTCKIIWFPERILIFKKWIFVSHIS